MHSLISKAMMLFGGEPIPHKEGITATPTLRDEVRIAHAAYNSTHRKPANALFIRESDWIEMKNITPMHHTIMPSGLSTKYFGINVFFHDEDIWFCRVTQNRGTTVYT